MMSEIDILYQISNLKEIDYKNTLAITGIIEILIEKNIITRSEFIKKINELDSEVSKDLQNI
ncbi:MAG TPA: hypothetical protein DDX02_06400 [Clostridiaceae bacterium]|nr:hypothetical protein [Clostridiaceae bacterium]HBF77444.1 hypothetical protein [Clostridiaceae bacterium]HBG39265.1 hypothetical protein [Clostridiaceae bacterium]HBN27427.1 hypothetical protein [Clostridiaceae bacterium]